MTVDSFIQYDYEDDHSTTYQTETADADADQTITVDTLWTSQDSVTFDDRKE